MITSAQFAQVFAAFLCGFSCFFGLVAGAETLLAQLLSYGNGRVAECLFVGVAEYERDIMNAFAVHVVHGIAATAAYTDHLDDAVLFLEDLEVESLRILVFFLIFFAHGEYIFIILSIML